MDLFYEHNSAVLKLCRWNFASIPYLVLLCNVLALIDVNLEEDHIVHGLVHLLQMRGDHLARSAPGGVEIDNHQFAPSSIKLVSMEKGLGLGD